MSGGGSAGMGAAGSPMGGSGGMGQAGFGGDPRYPGPFGGSSMGGGQRGFGPDVDNFSPGGSGGMGQAGPGGAPAWAKPFVNPSSGFGQPQNPFGGQMGGYGRQMGGGFGQPMGGYGGQPMGGYGGQMGGFGSPFGGPMGGYGGGFGSPFGGPMGGFGGGFGQPQNPFGGQMTLGGGFGGQLQDQQLQQFQQARMGIQPQQPSWQQSDEWKGFMSQQEALAKQMQDYARQYEPQRSQQSQGPQLQGGPDAFPGGFTQQTTRSTLTPQHLMLMAAQKAVPASAVQAMPTTNSLFSSGGLAALAKGKK